MPGTTPTYALRFPLLSEAPDGPAQIQNLALDVEAQLARMDTVQSQQVFTSSGNFAKPANLKGVWVDVGGASGGSAGAGTTGAAQGSAGSGGGGGEYARAWIPAASLAANTAVTIGSAGAAAGAVGGSGGAGGNSSFGGHVVANGGQGGAPVNAVNAGQAPGGAGGTGGGGTAANIFRVPGGQGDSARVVGGEPAPARGGDSMLGRGAAQGPAINTSIGQAGQLFGGGAAGAFVRPSTAGVLGSAGAAGVVRVEVVY